MNNRPRSTESVWNDEIFQKTRSTVELFSKCQVWWFKMRNEFKWVIVVAAKTYLKCGGKAAILEYFNQLWA